METNLFEPIQSVPIDLILDRSQAGQPCWQLSPSRCVEGVCSPEQVEFDEKHQTACERAPTCWAMPLFCGSQLESDIV
jgi:hypothetical protein